MVREDLTAGKKHAADRGQGHNFSSLRGQRSWRWEGGREAQGRGKRVRGDGENATFPREA